MKTITIAALLLVGISVVGSPMALAQDTSSQSSAADIEQTKLRQQYVPVFREVLLGKKTATFFQLDRRISTMIDLQLTSQLPLAQGQN